VERILPVLHNWTMVPDPILETAGKVDSLTVEIAGFQRRLFAWREHDRRFAARYSWDGEGRLASREGRDETLLYAYDGAGLRIACYRLDSSGSVTGRELTEWDERSRMTRRILVTLDPPAEETWTYEYDDSGRMIAEKRGNRVRVEKRDRRGRLEQEYLYDGETPDLVTDYAYDDEDRLVSTEVRDTDGSVQRSTRYTWDAEGRLKSENIRDAQGRAVKDELYVYGASHGPRWLERVTWVPDGSKGRSRRPKDVIYRSFTYGDADQRGELAVQRSVAFANGVYRGPVLGDRPEGSGVFEYNDRSRYEGEFRNGVMEGRGRLEWPDGRVMEGRFHDGLLEGDGRCTWADGSRYTGGFQRGLMHGPGVFLWADGTRFEGLFDRGRRTDQGAWERP